jgi:predicted transcriptional regulator
VREGIHQGRDKHRYFQGNNQHFRIAVQEDVNYISPLAGDMRTMILKI